MKSILLVTLAAGLVSWCEGAVLSIGGASRFSLREFASRNGTGSSLSSIAVDPGSGAIYSVLSGLDGTVVTARPGGSGVIETIGNLRAPGSDTFFQFTSTDIEFFEGHLYTVVTAPDAAPLSLVRMNLESGIVEALGDVESKTTIESGLARLGSSLFVTSGFGGSKSVHEFDLNALLIVGNVTLGFDPGHMELDPTSENLYIAPVNMGKVVTLNPSTGETQVTPVDIPGVPFGDFAVGPEGKFLYHTWLDTIQEVDISTGTSVEIISGIQSAPTSDVGFGPTANGSGSSLYFTDGNRIMELTGFAAVPEPSTGLLLILGWVFLTGRPRRVL